MVNNQNIFEHYNFVVEGGQKPIRIDKYLSDRIANISRTKIKIASADDSIIVNGTHVKENYKIKLRAKTQYQLTICYVGFSGLVTPMIVNRLLGQTELLGGLFVAK